MLSSLLYSLWGYDSIPTHNTKTFIKFEGDPALVGLILKGDESAYREKVWKRSEWCFINNLAFNPSKPKHLIINPQETEGGPCPTLHHWRQSEESAPFQILRHSHVLGSHMGHLHHFFEEKGTEAALCPKDTKEGQLVQAASGVLLSLLYRKYDQPRRSSATQYLK